MQEEHKVLLVEDEVTPEKKYGFLGGAPSFMPSPQTAWARYQRCPVCKQIMSGKRKKLREIQPDVFIHKACTDVLILQSIAKVSSEKGAEAK